MPSISFRKPVEGEDAKELVALCPAGVFGLKKNKKKEEVADVEDAYSCTMCRECIRSDKFNEVVELGKQRKQYIFTIESVGVIPPEKLFTSAIHIIRAKSQHYLNHLKNLKKANS